MNKQNIYMLLLGGALLGTTSVMSSCSKDDDNSNVTVNSDKSKLTALIDSVNTNYNVAVEGTKPGTYNVGSKATLKTSIDLSTGVKNDGSATQTAVNNATNSLRAAWTVFKNALIQEVSAANLVAQWKFDGNANDATGKGNNGTLMSGPTGPDTAPGDGATLPTASADRFGRAGMAYTFNNGAYIEVPYRAALNPQAVTISAWVKADDRNSNNYIVSLNRWQGYKFQIQDAGKPFLTTATTPASGNPTLTDHDADSGIIPLGTWTHVATSYSSTGGTGSMKFYVNGVMVKEWTLPGLNSLITIPEQVPLAIGQQLPKTWYNRTPAAATGLAAGYYTYYGPAFFKGAMDDIRIYNRALSDAEVGSIFNTEKAL